MSQPVYQTLLFEQTEGIGLITLNRRGKMNGLNSHLMMELDGLLDALAEDETLKAVIITGTRRYFCIGADVGEIGGIRTIAEAHRLAVKAQSLFLKLESLPRPTIAAVSGPALGGGCEMALACDVRIAAENAVFGTPEIKLGILPGAGGTQRLPRLIGPGRAKDMLYSGEPIDAREAFRIGLVNMVVPLDDLIGEARQKAAQYAARPAFALRVIKDLVNAGTDMDLHSALKHESRCFELLFSTEDRTEGLTAFLEKREPKFKGC
ncbi:MAG: enoyl-CoA hydratase/isomerase family protein [Proteobacteria bacterium]|nr:enoyl-CoA hydratase/isomerase family protein [Pseudomonadota bacterium]